MLFRELQKLSEDALNRQPEDVFDIVTKLGEGSYGSVYKSIHKEYRVWTEFTLIAYVGGMLGLTFGFSFPVLYNWIFEKAYVAWNYTSIGQM